jgi:hypothetical protein
MLREGRGRMEVRSGELRHYYLMHEIDGEVHTPTAGQYMRSKATRPGMIASAPSETPSHQHPQLTNNAFGGF